MVEVRVSEGVLEGSHEQNEYGTAFYSFKGVPYAQPPLGDLRFKAPLPPKSWTGVRLAKNCGPICYQLNPETRTASGSEDCLYLNIYSPSLKPSRPLAVMFYVHGGSFSVGSGNDDMYGPEYLIRHDIILVTINYRLEVLGFLCLDSEDVPGNAGMKDQVQALMWVKRNISVFGGDPENITLFGNRAGGVCVSFHLMSPMTKGLFKRAITQSGTAVNWWASSFDSREVSLALAKKLGCYSTNNKTICEFFKAQPAESLINFQVPIILAATAIPAPNEICFGVASEKYFDNIERYVHGDAFDLLREGIHKGVEVMNGYVENEGILGMIMTCNRNFDALIKNHNFFLESFVPKPMTWHCSMYEQFEVGRLIKEYYFKDKEITLDLIDDLIRLYSVSIFVYEIIQWQKICASSKLNTIYFYKFTCKSERNVNATNYGFATIIGGKKVGTHADDLAYLFPCRARVMETKLSSNTFKMIDNVTKLWTNFAKYGDPTPDDSFGVKWSPFTLEQQNFLEIGETLLTDTNPGGDELRFWEELYQKYLPQRSYTY